MQDRLRNFLPRHAALILALGVALVAEMVLTLEWSYPYCSNPDSGPAYAVTGMPLPYKTYSGFSSLVYIFMPHVYALNLLLLTAVAYPACRMLARRGNVRAGALSVMGLVFICLTVALLSFGLYLRWLIPVDSVADGSFMRYQELRPVSFGFKVGAAGECMPSSFWFPQGWHPR